MAKSKQLPGQLDLFDLIDSMQQRKIKVIKVSQRMWDFLQKVSVDMSTLPERPDKLPDGGIIGTYEGVPIVIDDDVNLYEIEYEEK